MSENFTNSQRFKVLLIGKELKVLGFNDSDACVVPIVTDDCDRFSEFSSNYVPIERVIELFSQEASYENPYDPVWFH